VAQPRAACRSFQGASWCERRMERLRHCRTELVDEMRCAIIALHASFDSSADLRAAILSGTAAARTVKHERVRSTQA
jgi:hypothetical protein